MGCFPSKEEFLKVNDLTSQSETVNSLDNSIIGLQKGGLLIKTSAGYIQFGIPPETLKDSLNLGLPVPEYYIVPREKFDWTDGISLMEFEFPVYYNFFLRKQNKTKMICDKNTAEQIRIIFQETLFGPVSFPQFEKEFVDGYEGRPDLAKELAHFAKNPFSQNSQYNFDQFIEFYLFDENDQVTIYPQNEEKTAEVRISKSGDVFSIFEGSKLISSFRDEIRLKQGSFAVFKTFSGEDAAVFVPPQLGFTVLGSSHGFDCKGSTSGFIAWINGKGVMVDPPPYSSKVLRNQGIPPNLIEKIIITHCHADHDAGAFHKIIEAAPVEFLSTATIINSFLRKYSAISGLSVAEISKLFQYRTIEIGHPLFILGARLTFSYSFHSIPALAFEIEFQNKRFFFSGDTFFNPPQLEQLWQQGVLSKERYQSLALRDFSKYDLIFHEAGIPPIHTPIKVLAELPDEVKEKIYLIHIAEKDVPKESKLKPVPLGLKATLVLIPESERVEEPVSDNLELLSAVEFINWVPFNRIAEIIKCFSEVSFKANDLIIKEKTIGQEFYIVKSGVVRIFSEDPNNSFSKFCYRCDYFGESAVIGDGTRLANVEALTDVRLLAINKSDFKWIFTFQPSRDCDKLGPMELMKNLSELRKAQEAEFINKNSIVAKMTENQKCLINMLIKEVPVKKGQILWRKNSKPGFCLFLKSGKMKVKGPKAQLTVQNVTQPGTLIGDFPYFLNQRDCESSAKCMSDGSILKLTKKKLNLFLNQYPGFFIVIRDKFVIP